MTKSLEKIQKENRKIILEAIHGCSYEEALQKELGFGCKILVKRKYYSEGNTKFEWGQGTIIVDTSIYSGDINLKEGFIYTANFDKEEIIEIIGKPITLNRVLLALENKFCYFHLIGGKDLFLTEISVDTGKIQENRDPIYFDFNWNIKKETLEEQSEETQRGINRLLTDI